MKKAHISTHELVQRRRAQWELERVRANINRVRNDVSTSAHAVKEFDKFYSIYKKRGKSFNKMPLNQFKYMSKEIYRIGAMKSSTVRGAKKTQMRAQEYFGPEYSALSRDDQSLVWSEFNKLKEKHSNTYDSNQILQLYKIQETFDGDVKFEIVQNMKGDSRVKFTLEDTRLDGRTKLSKELNNLTSNSAFDDLEDTLYKRLYNL